MFKRSNSDRKSQLSGIFTEPSNPRAYCSPSIIIQGNFHLSKHPNEWFDRFFIVSNAMQPLYIFSDYNEGFSAV